jgi:hypothetical protein
MLNNLIKAPCEFLSQNFPGETKEFNEKHILDLLFSGRGLKPGPPQFEAGPLLIRP